MSEIEDYAQKIILDPTNIDYADHFISSLRGEDGLFRAQEDDLFDYKLEYPNSVNDSYFVGICRIILGMHNSYGGILVLGVHDEKRSGGHNKKVVNIERLNTRLRELSNVVINVRHINLNIEDSSEADGTCAVDLLIIPKRTPNSSPAALQTTLGKYLAGTVWIRRGHEVLEATSRDTGFLFGPRHLNTVDGIGKIPSYLPNRPSTISSFVGRVDTLSDLFNWISSEDEPRKFLWGRGGSGKSTVAYEFAKIVRDSARNIDGFDGSSFERVVFLSAKEKKLNSEKGKIQSTKYVDFSTVSELLAALLFASDYSAEEDYSVMKISELEARVKELFDFENMLIVIDDIDTLTTKGEDAGFDLFYKLAIRAKKCVRLLYTQRNQPLSSENFIEVGGFERDEHFLEFVQDCCTQFKVPLPTDQFMSGSLRKDTEGIPLIVETIIGLRKTCGDYQKAHQIFLERRGDEARKYLFEREYEALAHDNKARHVLATISEFDRPVSNEEIMAIVQFGESNVSEAIGDVLGFFLSTLIAPEGATKYYVNPVTKTFLNEKTKSLDFGTAIVERVKNFKSAGRRKSKEVALIESKVRRNLNLQDVQAALRQVTAETSPVIVENAAFRMLRAEVYCQCKPARTTEAREDFQYCVDHSYENVEGMRRWFELERHVGSSLNQEKVCDYVIGGKSYADNVKNEFFSRKATVLYFRGRDRGVSTIDGFGLIEESLIYSVRAFNYFFGIGGDSHKNFRYVRSTAFSLVNSAKAIDYDRQLLKVFEEIQKEHGFLPDPLFDPFLEMLKFFSESKGGETGKRRAGLLKSVSARLETSLRFELPEMNRKCLKKLENLADRHAR